MINQQSLIAINRAKGTFTAASLPNCELSIVNCELSIDAPRVLSPTAC